MIYCLSQAFFFFCYACPSQNCFAYAEISLKSSPICKNLISCGFWCTSIQFHLCGWWEPKPKPKKRQKWTNQKTLGEQSMQNPHRKTVRFKCRKYFLSPLHFFFNIWVTKTPFLFIWVTAKKKKRMTRVTCMVNLYFGLLKIFQRFCVLLS